MQDVNATIEARGGILVNDKLIPIHQTYWWPSGAFPPEKIQSSMDIPLKIIEALPQKVDYQHGLSFNYEWDFFKVLFVKFKTLRMLHYMQ